jgi:hypothetical protein
MVLKPVLIGLFCASATSWAVPLTDGSPGSKTIVIKAAADITAPSPNASAVAFQDGTHDESAVSHVAFQDGAPSASAVAFQDGAGNESAVSNVVSVEDVGSVSQKNETKASSHLHPAFWILNHDKSQQAVDVHKDEVPKEEVRTVVDFQDPISSSLQEHIASRYNDSAAQAKADLELLLQALSQLEAKGNASLAEASTNSSFMSPRATTPTAAAVKANITMKTLVKAIAILEILAEADARQNVSANAATSSEPPFSADHADQAKNIANVEVNLEALNATGLKIQPRIFGLLGSYLPSIPSPVPGKIFPDFLKLLCL